MNIKKYCECEKQEAEIITNSECLGGVIREVIVGYWCNKCDREIDDAIDERGDDSEKDEVILDDDLPDYTNLT